MTDGTSRTVLRIWIDVTNAPHVPLFVPIISALQKRGIEVLVTARDFGQTVELASHYGLDAEIIGSGGARHAIRKSLAIFLRGRALLRRMRSEPIDLAVSHGSRGMLLACRQLGVRSLTMYDYEGASVRLLHRLSTYVMTPEALTTASLAPRGLRPAQHRTYPGLKEEVYLADFVPQEQARLVAKLDERITVVVRPPSDTAHYRSRESRSLFDEVMSLLASRADVHAVVLPRDSRQRAQLCERYDDASRITVLRQAVDGASLVALSDVVIGGGGTMNREAAVLGVPVLSIFKGAEGAVDHGLKALGSLHDIEHAEDVVPWLVKREHRVPSISTRVRDTIVETVVALAKAR